ncbi:MAG: flagellar motor switch protein FliG [Gammaproteobacteria bacterium]|nr:flagellar motor switch protein FliG [Gammaproteobacteria bacterium]
MDAAEDLTNDAGTESLNLSGSARAAILLMALGEDEASSILQFMEPDEVQSLGEAMAAISGVSQDEIGHTLDRFIDRIGKESSLGFGSKDYFKSTLTKAVGKDKANGVLSRIEGSTKKSGLSSLKWMDASVVTKLIANEHPQIIATVLSQLPSEQAGEILNKLPEELHSDLILRITRLDTLHPSALIELDEIIKQVFENNSDVELSGVGGVSVASEILNSVSKEAEEKIIEEIESLDSELCDKIKEGMFIFENLLALDDRGMQTLLRDITSEQLILALKGATPEMQNKIFKNMSSRAAELLKDDLDAKGPVKLSEVEEAQREIIKMANTLAEEGKIALSSKGDDFV